ncbi:MAG: EamA family transporter [Labilithrix sp.]|nr:EamA family transporter [Labilithrix sp.]
MSLTVALLVLSSAFAHASWNAIVKSSKDPENAIGAMMLIGGASGAVIALAMGTPMPPPIAMRWTILSGVLESGYFVLLARALARAPLGSVYTIARGGALVVVWPVSVFVLDERVSLGHVAGTLLVIGGLTATGAAGERRPAEGESDREKVRAGMLLAAGCALFIGGYHLCYKLALSSGGAPAAVNAISLCIGATLSLVPMLHRRAQMIAAVVAQPKRTVAAGLLGTLGFLVFLSAMKDAGAGSVLTLRNTSILFAQVLSFALGERPKRLGVAGAVLVTLGAAILAQA